MNTDTVQQATNTKKSGWNPLMNILLILCGLGILSYYLFASPHINSTPTTIHVSKNQTITEISQELEKRHVVRYANVTKFLIRILNVKGGIARGDYLFEAKKSTVGVAWQVAQSIHNVNPVRVTLKEGSTNEQVAAQLADKLAGFRKDLFLEQVSGKQGYVFPDTYFFFPLTTGEEIVEEMTTNFDNRILHLAQDIKTSGRSLSSLIVMASIIEKEANGKEDRGPISGILWKRIELGMPLQVDAARITYTTKGLPKEPIGNPSLASIEAALYPVETPYLFYLHDKSGMVHYARNFNEHRANITRFLK